MRCRRLPSIALVVLVLLAFAFAACSSPPPAGPEAGAPIVDRLSSVPSGPAGGRNSAETSTTDFPFAPGAAWGASQNQSNALSAQYKPQNTNSGQGGIVTAFIQGLTAAQQQQANAAYERAIKSDPVLESLAQELRDLMALEERPDTWETRVDLVRAEYTKARDALVGSLKESGVVSSLDLGNLQTLVNIGFANAYAGKDERPPTDEEVRQLARVLANPISAARGEAVVLGEHERTE